MAENQQLNFISKPHAHDVLSGRGNLVNRHPGNEHFRSLVKRYKGEYVACPKSQKAMYSKLIYDEIRSLDPPGRFLKQDSNTNLWHDIGKKMALAKTRQALREGAPEMLRDLQTFEQFCLHSTSEGNQAQAVNVASTTATNFASIKPNHHVKPILSGYQWRSSSAESLGSDSILSSHSIDNCKKNDDIQLTATMHNVATSRLAELPSYATGMASSSKPGEGTGTLLQVCRSANQMQMMDQPSKPWLHLSNNPSMLQNFSTRAPESQSHLALSNMADVISQQLMFRGYIPRDSTNQFTNIKCSENVPGLNSSATAHPQQCNVIYNVNGNNTASMNYFSNRTYTENAPFKDSASSSHQQQYNMISDVTGNLNAPTNQFVKTTGSQNAPFLNSAASYLQQHCGMINNMSRNENPTCLMPLVASLNSDDSDASNTRTDTQHLHYQLAYQQLLSKWNAQQNNSAEPGDHACTPFQNTRAKSA